MQNKFSFRSKLLIVLFLLISIFSFGKEVKIIFLETSDLHGRLFSYDYAIDQVDNSSGLTKAATIIKTERSQNKNVILIDNGDTVQDNSAELFNNMAIHPMISALNDLKYDAWILGNHEFNFEKSFLDRNVKAFKGKVLSANIIKDNGKNYVLPYIIKNVEGVRIAIIGITPPHIPMWEASSPEHFQGLTFLLPEKAITETLKKIEGKYDLLIGSFHLGREDEKGGSGITQLAEKFPQFNIIFAGHEHAIYNKEVNGVKTIEPGAYGSNVAKAVVVYNTDTHESTITTENISTKEIKEDNELKEKYNYVDKQSKEFSNQVLGKVTDTFIKDVDFLTGEREVTTMPTSQLKETPVIQLINEVQKYYANADVSSAALFNFGSNLEKGDFKRKDVAFIYKYTNTLVGVNITGENLIKYMEWSVSYYNQLQPDDLTISFDEKIRGYNYDMFSGINYKIDITKPKGSRIVNPTINNEEIQKDKIYKLAVNNYRFGTLLTLKLVKEEDKYYDSYLELQDGGRVRDLIIKYITEKNGGNVTPKLEGNWEIINYDFNNSLLLKLRDKIKLGEIKIPTSSDGRTLNVKSIKKSEVN